MHLSDTLASGRLYVQWARALYIPNIRQDRFDRMQQQASPDYMGGHLIRSEVNIFNQCYGEVVYFPRASFMNTMH